jgi:hypothetical protein
VLALAFTFSVVLFVLGPDLVSRWVLGFLVPRRSLSQNKGEEVTRAVLWVAGPLFIVWGWVDIRHVLGLWGNWNDVQVVASGLYSGTYFDANTHSFFQSLPRVAGMYYSLFWRLYVIVLIFALILNVAIARFRWLRNFLKPRWAKTALATIVLPRVSEWHVLLSDMLLPIDDVSLAVDVLTKSGILYQGGVQDRMLASDGSLQSLTLSDPRRFLRDDFRKAKDFDPQTKTEKYWRPIPGKLFVILGSDIASVNVRYPPKSALTRLELSTEELETVRRLLSKLTKPEEPPNTEL